MEPCGERVRVDAPRGVLTEELRERIVAHKLELLAHLRRDAVNMPDSGADPLAAELTSRVEAFRRQVATWTGSGIPLLTLSGAPPPQAGRCVSCGDPLSKRGWRCSMCFKAIYLALDAIPPEAGDV